MGNPHILVIPYPAQGHVIPLMELSQFLARNGCKITFINTEHNHKMINVEDDQIHVISISKDKNKPVKSSEAVMKVMPRKVEEIIEEINASESDKISCVLADQSIGWTLEIAEKKGIRRAAFCPAAAAQLVLGFSIPKLIEDGIIDEHGTPRRKEIIKISPTMPAMDTVNFVWTNMESQKNIFELMIRNNKSIKLTEWLLCNSTYDLEPAAFNLDPQILPIGPISAINKQLINSKEIFLADDSACLKWLDQQPQQSVIYIAFGSFTIFESKQLEEFALGLELCNRPFLWVARSDMQSKNGDFLEKFKQRVGNLGKVVNWLPQKEVLAHNSIACFVSHCGWNSTMEGLSNGVPFLCWPYFADQFFNKSYICDVWKIGLGLERDENGNILSGEVRKKVELVFINGEFKARALKLKEMAMNSVKEGGNSYQNLNKFVEWIKGSHGV